MEGEQNAPSFFYVCINLESGMLEKVGAWKSLFHLENVLEDV